MFLGFSVPFTSLCSRTARAERLPLTIRNLPASHDKPKSSPPECLSPSEPCQPTPPFASWTPQANPFPCRPGPRPRGAMVPSNGSCSIFPSPFPQTARKALARVWPGNSIIAKDISPRRPPRKERGRGRGRQPLVSPQSSFPGAERELKTTSPKNWTSARTTISPRHPQGRRGAGGEADNRSYPRNFIPRC